jgi:hypothetical protein
MFTIVDLVSAREALDSVEKFIYRERFRSLISDLTSPSIHINSFEEADKKFATLQSV